MPHMGPTPGARYTSSESNIKNPLCGNLRKLNYDNFTKSSLLRFWSLFMKIESACERRDLGILKHLVHPVLWLF